MDLEVRDYENLNVEEQKRVFQERVVLAVHERRAIWDMTHPHYGKMKRYHNAFCEILQEFRRTLTRRVTIVKIKHTWQKIRKAYVMNYKKNNGDPNYQTCTRALIDLFFLDVQIQRAWDLERAREAALARAQEEARVHPELAEQVRENVHEEPDPEEARAQRFQDFFDNWAREMEDNNE